MCKPVYISINTDLPPPPQVLQSSDLPAGLVNIITGSRDQLTAALATHSVIKAIWYWGSAEVRTKHVHQCLHFNWGVNNSLTSSSSSSSPLLCVLLP